MCCRYLKERNVIQSLLDGSKHAFVVYNEQARHFGDVVVTLCRTADGNDDVIHGQYEYNDPLFVCNSNYLEHLLSLVCEALSEEAINLNLNNGPLLFSPVAGRGFPVKQTNAVDCGVYVIMRFWALVTGQVIEATHCFFHSALTCIRVNARRVEIGGGLRLGGVSVCCYALENRVSDSAFT